MNKDHKVIQTLAEAAVDYYRLTGAGEDSDRQANILRTAAEAYRTATKQPTETLEQAWEAVTTEKIAAENDSPIEDSVPLSDLEGFENACTELRQAAENTADDDAKLALINAAAYLHDYSQAAQ